MLLDCGRDRQGEEKSGLFFDKRLEDTLMFWSYMDIPMRKPNAAPIQPHNHAPLSFLLQQVQYFTVNSP